MIDDKMLDHPFVEPECEVIEDDEDSTPEPFTFLDVLVYPVSSGGLSVLVIYALMPLVVYITSLIDVPVIGFLICEAALLASLLVLLSLIWYMTVCIRAGAGGQRRAPGLFESSEDDTPLGWLRELFFILAMIVFCIGPAFVVRYMCHVESMLVFWAILGIGLFMLPMSLLSMVMFDCLGALNPLLIIPSIFSTFFQYCLVVVLFSVPIVLIVGTLIVGAMAPILPVLIVIQAMASYLLIVAAGTLGWFFHKNEEKLRWDV